jgi:tellurite resistance protein TerA
MGIDYTKKAPAPAASAAPVPAAAPALVRLTKDKPQVSLTKQTGQLRVNLNWNTSPPAAGGGLLKRLSAAKGIDLDLGCLYEMTDGSKGVVQALGNSFGRLDAAPYIQLSGDDRSGSNAAGEDLFVNLAHASKIKRVLVFACIYSGAAGFEQADGVVVLTPPSGPPVEVRLDEEGRGSRMCAIALLESDGSSLSVRREVKYVKGGQDVLDKEYGWGMNWAPGRK